MTAGFIGLMNYDLLDHFTQIFRCQLVDVLYLLDKLDEIMYIRAFLLLILDEFGKLCDLDPKLFLLVFVVLGHHFKPCIADLARNIVLIEPC